MGKRLEADVRISQCLDRMMFTRIWNYPAGRRLALQWAYLHRLTCPLTQNWDHMSCRNVSVNMVHNAGLFPIDTGPFRQVGKGTGMENDADF